jgi:DNA-binding SARP family transcriptional activator/tetratricopeptide (TPR) repeat protein
MDFRFLGPLEVRSAGAPLPLGGQKQRGVLAVLLLNAHTVVTIDRLVDDIWGEAPPRTVEAYVQNCVSRLRAVLGRDTIETHPGGYLLRVAPEDVDATRFVRAIEAAQALAAPERVATLSEALGLWRGPPLAEFAYEPFAQPEIARFEELRLVALEVRLEALLELGAHGVALPELEALSARHPARERFRYLQMLALYRSGRQHDALAAFQDARRELVEGFGLDPGEELRALERMILQQDPSLRQPQVAAAAPEGSGAYVVLVAEPGGETVEALIRASGAIVHSNGDTVVGVYGAERRRDDDALRALRVGADIQHSVQAACVAVERVEDVDREGLGRDLLSHVSPGETIVGEAVLPLVAHAVDVVGHPGRGFRVLHVDEGADALPRRLHTRLVGRRGELARLHNELELVTAVQSARRLVVVGEAGIGKTRVVREFATQASAVVLSARCGHRDAPDIVGDLIAPLEPVERLLADEPDGSRVGAALRARATSAWTEEQWTLRRVIESVGRTDAVVVILDDLHWAPPHILDLFDYLAGWARGPILVIGVARPELIEARSDLEMNALHLAPLSRDESLELASRLPEHEALDSRLLSRLAESAEGNPLYIEQLVAWSSEGHTDEIPPTIDLLVAMRIEHLPASQRRALERAAVIGTEFWRSAVEAASPEDERPSVGTSLMALVRRRLVHPAQTPFAGQDGFRFHHALIRDVIYSTIPPEMRGRLHAAVARSLDETPEYDAVAGRHLEEAARVDATLAAEASRRLATAGMRALRRVDPLPAIDLLGRAARLVPEGSRKRELDWGAATATKFAGDPVRAEALLEDVAARSAAADDTPNELRARIEQVWPQLARGALRVADALVLLDHAVPVFTATEDEFELARIWDVTASIYGVYPLQARACEEAEVRARGHYERSGSTTGAADVRLAGAAWFGPTPVPEAIERCRQILAGSETPVWASFVQPFLAGLLAMEGQFTEARSVLEEARRGRVEFADPRTLDMSWAYFAAAVELRAGDLTAAERIVTEALARLRDGANTEWAATQGAFLAELLLRRGRFAEALEEAEAARSLVPPEHLTVLSVSERVRAVALAGLGRLDEALAAAQGITSALAMSDALVNRAGALLALADVLERAGEPGANDRRSEAVALLERKGDVVSMRSLASS